MPEKYNNSPERDYHPGQVIAPTGVFKKRHPAAIVLKKKFYGRVPHRIRK
jgi:hypothetical protein